jgi:serine/threonine protein kinase
MLEIGRGREATVYVKMKRNAKTGTSELYAVRVLHAKQTERTGAAHTLRLCALPSNPHVVRILNADPCTGLLLLEYVDGGTLADELICCSVSNGRAAHIVRQVLLGVAHLHAYGLIHGDISPGNVLIDHEQEVCKLTDYFGQSQLRGSPAYMAPEAARDKCVCASDVWSVGCLMLAVTGLSPWRDTQVRLEDGSVVDLSSSAALLYHLAFREIAVKGPPEFCAYVDREERMFFDLLCGIFQPASRRVCVDELVVQMDVFEQGQGSIC